MNWVDEVIKQALKQKPNTGKYIVSDWKTPSGQIHIGALRGVLIHNAVYEALAKQGQKAHFFYGFDDFDPMDGLPVYLSKSYKKYLGQPLSEIPAPEGQGSYGQYYSRQFQKVFGQLGLKPEILWSSELYQQGKFNCAFDLVIKEAAKIRQLYRKISQQTQPKDWLAVQMICQKCGQIGTTRAYDFKDGKVFYICDRNYVKYAQGCGFKGADSPYNGQAKLPWKVEWAAKWFILGTDIEGAGKDHQTKGGSHDLASAILREVFGCQPPVNIFYEWFLIKGKKMSSSAGVGLPAADITELLPAALIRFLILKTKPRAQINFNLEGETIPQLYDEFDRQQKDFHFRFSQVAFLIQMPHINLLAQAQKEKGSPLSPAEKTELEERAGYARIWLEKLADEKYIFKLQPKLPRIKLTSQQKQFLAQLSDIYQSQQSWTGEKLHSKIHEIKNQLKISPQAAFGAIYQIFLAKDFGPQAGWFLAALDKKLVEKRLKQGIKVK